MCLSNVIFACAIICRLYFGYNNDLSFNLACLYHVCGLGNTPTHNMKFLLHLSSVIEVQNMCHLDSLENIL